MKALASEMSSSGGMAKVDASRSAASSAMPAVGSLPSSAARSGRMVSVVAVATIRGEARRGDVVGLTW